MKSIEEVFRNYSKKYQVNENFEDRVYARIKRKKAIRKAVYSSFFVFSLFLILFLVFSFLPETTQDKNREAQYANRFSERGKEMNVKEEIPVIEDVFFASFDDRTDYAIEQVIITEEEEGI
ncbi:MAG: hypothetical protein KAT17_07835 [Candidatus Aminicenantes bacterium]|nr:hypothetical protein [Candidatus Aminicenantes bacterium]